MSNGNDFVDDRSRQCTGKRGYQSKFVAKRVLRRARGLDKNRGALRVYKCPWCNLYHVGSKPGTKKKPAAE